MRVIDLTLPIPDVRLRPSWSSARHVRLYLARDYRMLVKKRLAEAGVPQPYFQAAHVLIEIRRRKTRHNRNPDHDRVICKPLLDALTFDRPREMNPHGHIAVWIADAPVRVTIVANDNMAFTERHMAVRITEESPNGLQSTPE